jgi:hypothetical protein
MDIDVFPNSLEYWGPAGMVFFRTAQIRWMPIRSDSEPLIFVLERLLPRRIELLAWTIWSTRSPFNPLLRYSAWLKEQCFQSLLTTRAVDA